MTLKHKWLAGTRSVVDEDLINNAWVGGKLRRKGKTRVEGMGATQEVTTSRSI